MSGGEFSIGIEEEYQLVDPSSGALVGRAPRLLAGDERRLAKQELQRTMIEAATPICASVAEACTRLAEQRAEVGRLAAAQGVALAAAGLHPVGPYPEEQITDDPRYRRLADSAGPLGRGLHIFGVHVHVAVPSREAAVRAMCGATPYIPLLLAVSASSPFHRGVDTGFVSFRTLLRDMFPEVGPPFPVASAAEYDRLIHLLSSSPVEPGRSGAISWDIRPSPRYPTLEFRFFDACPWLDDVAVLAAFARALTVMFVDRPPPQPTGLELQVLRENRWRAARYGLAAQFFRLDPVTGEERHAPETILALMDRLAPLAERLGDGGALAAVRGILRRGNAATAMRQVFRRQSSYPAVTRWVVEQTMRPPDACVAA